jgi:hypothetical protein
VTKLTKQEALEAMGTEHDKLLALFSLLSESEWLERGVRPTPEPGQSCKDILGHLFAWEVYMRHNIAEVVQGNPRPDYPTVHTFNQQIFEDNKDKNLAEMQAEFHCSYDKTKSFIENLTEAEYEIDVVWQLIAYNTYNHYKWTIKAIKEWRKAQGKPVK